MRLKNKIRLGLVTGLVLAALVVKADSCYNGGTSSGCNHPGADPTSPGLGWSCTASVPEDSISGYNPDPTNKGFYVKARGCRAEEICSKTGQRDQTVYGPEGTINTDQEFQDGSCTAG